MSEVAAVAEIPSPCIRVCRLRPVEGWCEGCGRSLDEIAAWGGAKAAERLAILASAADRLACAPLPARDTPLAGAS